MQVLHQASAADLREHKQQVNVLNAQLTLEPTQQDLVADAWVLYPIQEQSFEQTVAAFLVQDNPEGQLHQELSKSSQSTQEVPPTALATSSEWKFHCINI